MARPRAVSFQALEVHRPARPDARRAPANARPTFADLLRLRRGPAPPADDQADEPLAPLPMVARQQQGADDDDAPDHEGEGDPRLAIDAAAAVDARHDDSLDWVDALAPTPAMIETMLQAPGAVGGPRRVGAAPPHPLVASIAQTVARFCNEPQVNDSEGWRVRMPLRDDVLPSTVLDLGVSSCWLQLRFETSSDSARDLLFLHRAALSDLLATALNRQRDIAITID